MRKNIVAVDIPDGSSAPRKLTMEDVSSLYQLRKGTARETHIVAQIGEEVFRLISLSSGNRYTESNFLSEDFQVLPPNTTITLTVGSA